MNPVRFFIRVLLFSILLVLAHSAQANFSLLGAELTYRHIDSNRYAVYLKLYRDCNGGPVQKIGLQYKSGNTQFTDSSLFLAYTKDITGISPNCPVQSKCQGSNFPYGVEEQLWIDTVDLRPFPTCEWNIAFKHCCRSSEITTGMAGQPFYIRAMLNKCVPGSNSSPQFISDVSPLMFMCRNNDLIYSNNALDTIDQADSIVYKFGIALQDENQSVNYSSHFSPTRPLMFLGFPNTNLPFPGGITLEESSGNFLFRPIALNQVGVVVIEVVEHREINGVMMPISVISRDIQARILDCPGLSPTIDPPFSAQICVGDEYCFSIHTNDNDPDDTVRIAILHQLQNLDITYSPDTVKHAWAQVCWTPSLADLAKTVHHFSVVATDNSCALAKRTSRLYSMVPRNNRPQGVLNAEALSCRELALSHQVNSSYPSYTFRYRVFDAQDSLKYESFNWQDTALLDTGWYRVELLQTASGMCDNLIYDSVYLSANRDRDEAHYVEFCAMDSIQFGLAGGILSTLDSLHWSLWDGLNETNLGWRKGALRMNGRLNQNFVVRSDLGLCQMQDSVFVEINPVPQARFILDKDTLCVTNDSLVIYDSSTISKGMIKAWSWNQQAYSSTDSIFVLHLQKGSWNRLRLQVQSDKLCESGITDSVYVDGPLNYQLIPDQLNIQQGHSASFELLSSEPITAYRWERKGWQGADFLPVFNGIDIYGMDAPKLELWQIQAADSGSLFRCIVTRHGCTDTSNEALLQVLRTTTSVNSGLERAGFRLYPNPVSQKLYLIAQHEMEIEIVDQLGKVRYFGKLGTTELAVDLTSWSSGVYFVRSQANPGETRKFIKISP